MQGRLEINRILELIDDMESYYKNLKCNVQNSSIKTDLAKRIIEFEKECLEIGIDDYKNTDTVDDMISYIDKDCRGVFKWLEEKGIEYFDYIRLKEINNEV